MVISSIWLWTGVDDSKLTLEMSFSTCMFTTILLDIGLGSTHCTEVPCQLLSDEDTYTWACFCIISILSMETTRNAPMVSSVLKPCFSLAFITDFINRSWASTDATAPTRLKMCTSSKVPPWLIIADVNGMWKGRLHRGLMQNIITARQYNCLMDFTCAWEETSPVAFPILLRALAVCVSVVMKSHKMGSTFCCIFCIVNSETATEFGPFDVIIVFICLCTLQKQIGCFNHIVVTLVADKQKRHWLLYILLIT